MADNIVQSAMRGVPFVLQSLATALNAAGNVIAIPKSFVHHTITIKGNGTATLGAIQIESANAPDYAGTWGQIGGGPITILTDTELIINFEGIFEFIRARVSAAVTGGGTVTVTYMGAP